MIPLTLTTDVDVDQHVDHFQWGKWPSGLYSFRQVTEVKLGRVRSDFGWVTTEA